MSENKRFLEKWNIDENHYLFKLTNKNLFYSLLLKTISIRISVLSSFLKKLPKKSKILDFGCGTGYHAYFLEKELNFNVTGVDISKRAIDLAKNINKKFNTNINFEVGDCENTPFKDESFDAVFSTDVLAHLPNPEKGIKEMYRVLKKGGIVSIFSESKTLPKYKTFYNYIVKKLKFDPWVEKDLHISVKTKQELIKIFKKTGFKILKIKSNPTGHIIFHFILPREDDDLYEKYPKLNKYFFIKVLKLFAKINRIIGKILPLKVLQYLFASLVSKIMMEFTNRDYGGVYFKLKKM